jgi:hypothetical protein
MGELSPEAAGAKALIEQHIPNPESAYWKGDLAAELQTEYRDIVRAEIEGYADKVGPEHGVDVDLPISAAHYNLAAVPGAHLVRAEDRAIIDAFAPAAHTFGLGQRKFAEAVGFAMTADTSRGAEALVADWHTFAMARGWSDEQIAFALQWAADFDERGGAPPAPAKAAATTSKTAEAERDEIEQLIGNPGSEYWRGPRAEKMQQRYRELIAAGVVTR